MQAYVDLAQTPRLGPLPIPVELGRKMTSLHHGLLRSAFSGQANGILLSPGATFLGRDRLVLNSRDLPGSLSRVGSSLPPSSPGWPGPKSGGSCRSSVPVFRAARPLPLPTCTATGYDPDQRLADAELLRAAVFVDALAEPGDVVVLAGDFNVTAAALGPPRRELISSDWGFSDRLPKDRPDPRSRCVGPKIYPLAG